MEDKKNNNKRIRLTYCKLYIPTLLQTIYCKFTYITEFTQLKDLKIYMLSTIYILIDNQSKKVFFLLFAKKKQTNLLLLSCFADGQLLILLLDRKKNYCFHQ